ncbi:MAG: hypothetical protein RMJ88_07470 [Thermogemmata sp.]|nr:hypothetical protein [Thermogemmata sp.]
MPERTLLLRLLKTHWHGCNYLLAEPTFFTVIDTFPIEWIFPIRQGRSVQQVGRKGRDKGGVGVKLCWLLNQAGRVVAWDWNTLQVHDQCCNPLVRPFIG